MLSPDQISELHRLHFVEKWSLRKIARHMRIGRRTIAKYLEAPAAKAAHRDRASKLDPFKEIIAELLQQDPERQRPRDRPAIEASWIRRRLHHRQGLLAHPSQEHRCPPRLRSRRTSPRRSVRCGLGPLRRAGLQRRHAQALRLLPGGISQPQNVRSE